MKAPLKLGRRGGAILGASLLLLCPVASGDPVSFTPAETERILAHGPWPPPAARDPSNDASGRPAAIAFGERLFFSPRLSGTGSVLCASCHEPWRAFTDGRQRALGLDFVDRNTLSLMNVRLDRWFGWDGSNDNLWAQSIRPLLEPREMNSSAARIGALIRGDPMLSLAYKKAFGAAPGSSDETVLVAVGKALAAYQETLASGRTLFDEFRDALARGDSAAAGRFPEAARLGLKIFLGKGGCESCHSGPGFSDGDFHQSGIASRHADGEPDRGREEGIRKLLASRFNLLGPYNDDPSRATAAGTRAAAGEPDTTGAFRTPSLRNSALTAPYMHDGSVATLCEVARLHPRQGALSTAEMADLTAFLTTLTDVRSPPEGSPSCR